MRGSFINSWGFAKARILAEKGRALTAPRIGSYNANELVEVVFEYLESMQGRDFRLTLSFANSRDPRVNAIPSQSLDLAASPENYHYAYVYPAETYENWALARKVLLAVCMAYYLGLAVSLVAGDKRIMAEGLMVAQVAFAGLAGIQLLNPLQASLDTLVLANNPFNLFYSDSFRPFDDPLLPDRFRGSGLYAEFLYNLNSGLLLVLLPLLVGLFLALVSRCHCLKQDRRKSIGQVARLLVGEFVWAGLTVVGCVAGCSSVLELKYGIAGDVSSLAICGLIAGLLLFYLFMWFCLSSHFGEYAKSLAPERPSAVAFGAFYFCTGPLAGVISYLFCDLGYSAGLVAGYAGLLLVWLFVRPVFNKVRDRVRVQLNLATVVLTQLPYLLFQRHPDYSHLRSTDMELMLALVIPLFLALNLLANLGFFLYLFVTKCCAIKKEEVSPQKENIEEL